MLHNRKSLYGAAVALAMAAGLAACGGGGGGSTLPSTGGGSTNNPGPTQMGQAKMTIQIPAKTSSAKSQYVSSSTQSITIAQNGTQIGEQDLTATSSGCAAGAGGARTCTATFSAPVGANQVFQVTMWDQTGGKGNKLSTGNVTATIQAGAVANVPVTLDGVPVSVAVVLGSGTLPVGTASTTSVTVVAKDSGGNVIIGPGGYATPITLAISGDKYQTLSLSESTVNSPGQTVTLTYKGGTNTGSTITPSIGSTVGTPATFAGQGASMAMFQYYDPTNSLYVWPYVADALPNGNGAIVAELEENVSGGFGCCPYGIAIASPTSGVTKIYVGDTSDYYNPPSPMPTYPAVTVVHGMSNSVETDTFESYDSIAHDSTGNLIYYGASTTTGSYPGCSGTATTGTIGVLNLTTNQTQEYILKGYPGSVKVDSAGNVWWIEYPGHCQATGTYLISGTSATTYAIGELKAGSTTPIETTFASAGITDGQYPGGMSISADGTTMFITDYRANVVTKVATAGTPAATSFINLVGSTSPFGVATSSDDGTTLWSSDNDPNDSYLYGWVPQATTTFSQSSLKEAVFPISYGYSYTVAYGDGSFWYADACEYSSGIGRINVSSGTPQVNFYQQPGYYPEVNSVSAGGGYVWATDYDYYNIDALQYGAQSSGTVAFNRSRAGNAVAGMAYPQPAPARRYPFFMKRPPVHITKHP